MGEIPAPVPESIIENLQSQKTLSANPTTSEAIFTPRHHDASACYDGSFEEQKKEKAIEPVDILVIGAGIGGIGAIVSLLNEKEEQASYLSINIIESHQLGGTLGENKITANSSAFDFIEDIESSSVKQSLQHPSGQRLIDISEGDKTAAPQLPEVGEFYRFGIGEALRKTLPPESFIYNHAASVVVDGTIYTARTEEEKDIASARHVILATGAKETILSDLQPFKDKLALSQEIFKETKLEEMKEKLLETPFDKRKIAIVGNKDGAWALVYKLLDVAGDILPEKAINVIARHPTKVYFDTVSEALAVDYQVLEGDVCPKTGRVNRFGAIQQDAKAIYLKVASGEESRVTIRTTKTLLEAQELLDEASYIVQSTGLSTNNIPVKDASGNIIGPLVNEKGKAQVNEKAQLLNFEGNPIPNMYGIGAGYDGVGPTPEFGGQPNYTGSIHAANFYRLSVGPMIAEQIISEQKIQNEQSKEITIFDDALINIQPTIPLTFATL